MTLVRVSVVIPAHDAADSLTDAVQSALAQRDVDVDVIVVNDRSADDTGAVATVLARDGRVTVVHRVRTGGPSVARNDGLRRAWGDFVLFLDADDTLEPSGLAHLVAGCGARDVAAAGRFRAVDDDGEDLDIGTWSTEQLRPVVRRHGEFVPNPGGLSAEAIMTRLVTPPPGGVLVRRGAALDIGGFDVAVRRSEDVDFLVRLASTGRIALVDDVVLRYRRRATQRSAHTRRRQLGRLRTTINLIARAPSRTDARARARGARAHHLDRARTRWRFGDRTSRDAASALRSVVLAGVFGVLGTLAAWRAPRSRTGAGW